MNTHLERKERIQSQKGVNPRQGTETTSSLPYTSKDISKGQKGVNPRQGTETVGGVNDRGLRLLVRRE